MAKSSSFILDDRTLKIDLSSLETTCSSFNFKLSKQIQLLVTRLLRVHYTGRLHVIDNNHLELSIPDPELLQEDGPKELASKHLYINLSKFAAEGHSCAARCVKTNKFYNIKDLLEMVPIQNRNRDSSYKWYLGWEPDTYLKHYKDKDILTASLVFRPDDVNNPNQKVISPGTCIPLTDLPPNHPAILYLNERGYYDMNALVSQFEASFCTEENPQIKHLKFGKDTENYIIDPFKFFTPQGKIIFNANQLGVTRLWQARYIDKTIGDDKLQYMHFVNDPYGRQSGYYKVAVKNKETGKWDPVDGVNPVILKQKYVIAPGTKAGMALLGFDAARAYNLTRPVGQRVIGLCEGVLDAARIGAPFCSYMGGSLSVGQMKLISNGDFDKILIACDHDVVGQETIKKLRKSLNYLGGIDIEEIDYPLQYKDLGEITDYNVIKSLREKYQI